MLSAHNVLTVSFSESELYKLTEKRLKSLKRSCYEFVGNRFYCCESRCEFRLRDEQHKKYYNTFQGNINLISKMQKKFING